MMTSTTIHPHTTIGLVALLANNTIHVADPSGNQLHIIQQGSRS
jgi:hypothetical protein